MRAFELLLQKPQDLSKILVCPHGHDWGLKAVRTFFGQRGRGGNFVLTPIMNGSKPIMNFSKLITLFIDGMVIKFLER